MLRSQEPCVKTTLHFSAHRWYSVSILFVYRNDFLDLKQHVLLEYKENNLKMKKYFMKDMAIEWDVCIEGKQDILSTGWL